MPNQKTDYHIYSHINPSIFTLGDFVSDPSSIGVGLDIKSILLYTDEFGNSNLNNLINLYSKDELIKFKKLIDSITSTNINAGNVDNSINIQVNNENNLPLYSLKNETAFDTILNSPVLVSDQLYKNSKYFDPTGIYDYGWIYYTSTPGNQFFLSKLDTKAALLFKKFIYRVETETDYHLVIQSSGRDVNTQNKQIQAGNSDSEFSYHLLGLAIDIYLRAKTGTNTITSKLPAEWLITNIKEIADEMKIRWGGNSATFTKAGYDSVHFDLANFYNVDKQRTITALSNSPSVISENNNSNNSDYFDLPIKIGTILALPLSQIDRSVLSTETNQTVTSTDYEAFLAKQLVDIYSDKGYVRTFPTKIKAFKGDVKEIFPYISVWVWSRSLSIASISNNNIQYNHQIINITPYIISLNTSVTENGGSFNFTVPPLIADLQNKGNSIKDWSVVAGTKKNKSKDKDYVATSHIHYIADNNDLKRNRLYFDKVLSKNDLIFIKFERLELEDRGNLDDLEKISINDLPNQIFDMIGLIDDVNTDTQHSSADIGLSISGRDLTKLLIDDGVYFYPTAFTADGIFANTGATNTRLKRFGSNGEYLDRFQASNKSIEKSLKFIINNLGSIEICPSDLFNGYKSAKLDITQPLSKFNIIDKRSMAYQLIDEDKKNVSDQNKDLSDKKSKILNNIQKICNKNGFLQSNSLDIYNIIKTFLFNRKQVKKIIFVDQLIKTWQDDEYNTDIIPKELDNVFILFDRLWLIEKQKLDIVKSQDEYSAAIVVLSDIYDRLDKISLNETHVDSIKNLNREENIGFNTENIFIDKIRFETFIDEINTYVNDPSINKRVFTSNDLNAINTAYTPNKLLGKPIKLGILNKRFKDLNNDEISVFNDIYQIIITEDTQNKKSAIPQILPLAGIWQIIKLVIDDSVKDRRITDSSIGNENGSIINAFRKICQDPFCEFYTDTYGDQFYLIARKKPFDRESIISMLQGRVNYDKPQPIDASKVDDNEALFQGFTGVPLPVQNLIIDIDEVDVISDSLKYSTEAYSWYKLALNNLTTGASADMSYAYLKAVYFDEFADIFGSRPLDLSTSYIPYSPIIDKNKELPQAYFIKQGILDLKYMIESNAHLPFTRYGTIVMNGDRRIKRGTFVRLKSTNEIFYVDAVSNDYKIDSKSIDRTTTIQVSRGMVERFITGVNYNVGTPNNDNNQSNNTVNVSYFNVCDLPIDESIFNNVKSPYSAFSDGSLKQWKVNKLVFNFFLKKLQFAKNDNEISNSGLNIFQ